jgi:hypothetical protein
LAAKVASVTGQAGAARYFLFSKEDLMAGYDVIKIETGVPIKTWTRGVGIEDAARRHLRNP